MNRIDKEGGHEVGTCDLSQCPTSLFIPLSAQAFYVLMRHGQIQCMFVAMFLDDYMYYVFLSNQK